MTRALLPSSLRPALRPCLLAGLGLLLSCGGRSTPVDDQGASADAASQASPDDALGIVLHAIGSGEQAPARIVIHADTDLFSSELVGGTALDGTQLLIDPAVDGTLQITDRSELAFEPTQGFRPDTAYTVHLASLSTLDRTVEPAGADDWTLSFHTPALALLRVAARQRDRVAGQAQVDLVFSADVDPDQVARRLELKIDGQRMKPASVVQGSDRNVVRVQLSGKALSGEKVQVEAELQGGVPWRWDDAVLAPAGSGQVELTDGEPIEILGAMVKEGASGHYVELVCNDHAVQGSRWYWDRDTWDGWQVSPRCLLDADEVQRVVHLGDGAVSMAQAPAGFRLFADLPKGPVHLHIDAGARTVDGGVLPLAYDADLVVPERKARVAFRSKGRYLPRSAWRSLPLQHLNVPAATLTIRYVPPQNLAFWLSGDEPMTERTSQVVLQTRLALGGAEDELETSWVDVGSLLPDAGRGVYELTVQGVDEHSGATDSSRLLLTNMALVAKRGATRPGRSVPDQVQAWALDVQDDHPIAGVGLSLIRPSGQVLTTCQTDTTGGCTLSVPDSADLDEAPAMAIVATHGDDLSYLKFDDLELRAEDDTSGAPYQDDVPYRAAVWTDRGVYRPGDVAHLAALLRQRSYTAPATGLPVVARVRDPQGHELRREVLATNDAGMVSLDLPFADFATTGTWRVALEVADRPVGSTSFSVEEFVPERMAVQAQAQAGPKGNGWLVGSEIPVDIDARWLFGGKAGGSRVEVACSLEAAPFVPTASGADAQGRWSYGLAFQDQQPPPPVDLGTVEAHLDEDGHGTVSCPGGAGGAAILGSASLVARVSVFEGDSGRSTRATATATVHPAPVYVGLATSVDQGREGQSVKVQGQVVDWSGKVQASAVTSVELRVYSLETEYGWVWDEESDDTIYRRLQRRVLEETRSVPVSGGSFSTEVVLSGEGGGWLVEARADGARTERYVEGDGSRWYWDPWDQAVDQTPRPQKPTWLKVSAPEQAEVGERVTVTTRAPYAGRMLLTVETDRVQYSAWKDVDAGDLSWTVPLAVDDGQGGHFAPNVYVTALLLKDPHLESPQAFVPDRAFGVASVRIRPADYSLPLTLDVPAEIRPWSTLTVGLDAGPLDAPTYATVAVVDEGILSLTHFTSPDPRDQVFARRALGVASFETIGWTLLTEPGGTSSRTGGDASGPVGGRVQMVKPVALWSGVVPVPASGKVQIPVEVPGYQGQLRVMAVVAGPTRMGSAAAPVTVRDPIVLQTTLPRFLTAGDLAQVPVRLTNGSGKAQTVTVSVEVQDIDQGLPSPGGQRSPVLELASVPGQSIELADGASQTVLFTVAARRAPGAARLKVTAKAGSLLSHEELEIPVATAEPELRQVSMVPLHAGDTSLTAVLAGWTPGTDHTGIWLTASPYAQALTHLGYLVHYPYGCIEQTTSSTRALLYVRTMVQEIDPALGGKGAVDEMVAKGIERVRAMQTPSGGFAYWPGGGSPTPWGTAYATQMLLDAREAGYDVPQATLDGAIRYLDQLIAGRITADGEVAYAHYIVARAGKARPAQALRVLESLQAVDRSKQSVWQRAQQDEDAYLLMAALYQGGDHRYESTLKQLGSARIGTERVNDWTFWSSVRSAGMRLSVFQDQFGPDPAGAPLADQLAQVISRRPSGSYTTQELAWAITALGKRTQATSGDLAQGHLKIDGKAVDPHSPGAWGLDFATSAAAVELSLPRLDGAAWALVTTRGVRKDTPAPLGGDGLKLERSFVDAEGAVVDPARLPLGTALYIRLDLSNSSGRSQQNVALVDRLPAGWEIENPRLSGTELPAWAQDLELWSAEHMNLRDDRMEIFGSLASGQGTTVIYAVRAVTAGTFVLPPVQAEAMYDPQIWARRAGGTVQVVGPWDDSLL